MKYRILKKTQRLAMKTLANTSNFIKARHSRSMLMTLSIIKTWPSVSSSLTLRNVMMLDLELRNSDIKRKEKLKISKLLHRLALRIRQKGSRIASLASVNTQSLLKPKKLTTWEEKFRSLRNKYRIKTKSTKISFKTKKKIITIRLIS